MLRLAVTLLALVIATAACGDEAQTPETADPTESPKGSPTGSPTDSPASSPTEPGEPSDVPVVAAPSVAVGAGPVGVTSTEDGAVWVVSAQAEAVQRIPPGATEPDLTVEVPGVPLRATAAFGSLWVTSFEGEKLLRLDPGTGTITGTVRTGAGPEGVTSGFGSVWMVAQDAGRLLRIDPSTTTVEIEIEIPVGSRLVTAGPEAVYVSAYADNTVLRIDPTDNTVTATSPVVCEGPQSLAVLGGQVWVACTLSEEIVALDATSLEKVTAVPVDGSPDTVVALPGKRLAVIAEEGPRLVVLDAQGAVLSEQVLGEEYELYDKANLDLAVAGGEVWVTSFDADRVYHVPVP